MRKIEFAHEILSESRRSTQIYLESGRDYDKVKANMYSVFECYAHGLINWNQVRTRWHSSIVEYLNLYADRPDLYLSESSRMLSEYEATLQTHKPALDEYKRVNEQKMTSNIVVKGKLNESQAKDQSNVYFNRRALTENQLKDTATMKTWKRVQESYPNLTSKDEMRIRMLTIFEGSTVDTTKLVTTYMSEEPTAISGPMQTSMRPKPRPVATANNNLVDVYPPRGDMEMDPENLLPLPRSPLAPTTSPRPMPRPANLGSTSTTAPTTSPRPMPRPKTLNQSANNNIRKEAAAIFNKIKVAANEGYKVLPPMDKERYGEIPGLEGPFTTLSGKVVYYDPKEGAYYDRDTDMYLSNDEYTALNSDYRGMQDERDINVREADIPLAHPNYMDTKNNPEILSAFEKQRQNWLKTNPWGGDVDDLNDLVNFGNKIPKPLKGIDTRPVKSTLTKGSMNFFKDNPGRGLGEADLDEKAKWRSSSAAKKITDPDKDLGMADYDYHHENPRSTGRLKSTADTETEPHSIINRAKSKINSIGKRKGMISKADINRVKSNAFNTLNKEEVEPLDELSPQTLGSYAYRATKDASDNQKKVAGAKDRWTGRQFQGRANKREKGADMAIDKIRGNYNVKVHAKDKVAEAVTLDYSRYMRAHGKKPRDAGMGSSTWMFTTSEFGDPGEDEIFQFQGSFADAKKAAAKWAKSQDEYRFYVMEDSNGSVKEAGGIGGGMSGTKFSKAADYAPAVGAGVRGAVDNVTMGTGKYARAAADYGIKNLGSLAGISNPTTWDTEINQELEKDLAAQTDHPVAWDIGDKAATAAQVLSGIGAAKALGTAAIKQGVRMVDRAAIRAAEKTALKAAEEKAARKAASELRYSAMGMSNAELANAAKVSKSPALTRELERRSGIEKLPDLPVVNDFQLGAQNALKLTPKMQVPPKPLKLTPDQMIPRSRKIIPFPKKP
jgi:hypothetical protein